MTFAYTVAKTERPLPKLLVPKTTKVHPVFHASLLKKCNDNSFPGHMETLPPSASPIMVQWQEEYLMKQILESKIL